MNIIVADLKSGVKSGNFAKKVTLTDLVFLVDQVSFCVIWRCKDVKKSSVGFPNRADFVVIVVICEELKLSI